MTQLTKRLFCKCGNLAQSWNERHKQRTELRGLSENQLSDIGLNQFDALQEAKKPFWKP